MSSSHSSQSSPSKIRQSRAVTYSQKHNVQHKENKSSARAPTLHPMASSTMLEKSRLTTRCRGSGRHIVRRSLS